MNQAGFIHMVYFWMRESGNAERAAQLAQGCRKHLAQIPGVLRLEVGFPAGTPRDVVDNTYGVALLVEFADRAAQDAYQEHPDHLRFIAECEHLWSRLQVYDTQVTEGHRTEVTFQKFLDVHLMVVEPLLRDMMLASWDMELSGSDEDTARAADLNAQVRKIYANADNYAVLKALQHADFADPLLARQHHLLLLAYQSEQMPEETIDNLVRIESEVGQIYNTYRAEVPAGSGQTLTDNDLRKILRESNDSALRLSAWEGNKRLGTLVADKVLQLVRLRNEAARQMGFPNHYTKAMMLDELDEERVFTLFGQLADATEPLWQTWKSEFDRVQAARFGITPEELRPWHYTDPFFQEAPPGDLDLDRYFVARSKEELATITDRFFSAIGLPVGEILARSDLYEKPNKNQHAFCTDMDRKGDVRVLCNNQPTEYWMGTMLHEFGHAVYDYYSDRSLPFLLRGPAHTLSTEAIAELMGRFSKDGTWLHLYADVPAEEAAQVGAQAQEALRVQFLVSTRWMLTMCHFERELYRDPEQDVNRLWWDMVERYQGIRRPDNRDAPDWAAKLHLALAPVYYQNYLLGEMMAAQLLRTLQREVLAGKNAESLFTDSAVGTWLKEKIFLPGNVREWEAGLEYATGERLNPAYFVQQLHPT